MDNAICASRARVALTRLLLPAPEGAATMKRVPRIARISGSMVRAAHDNQPGPSLQMPEAGAGHLQPRPGQRSKASMSRPVAARTMRW